MNSSIAALIAPSSGVAESVSGYLVGMGDGVTTVFAAPPEITSLSALYRRDWQWVQALSETARTNLLNHSNNLGQAAFWVGSHGGTGSQPATTSNYAAAPDGSMTATRVVLDKGSGTTSSDWSSLAQLVSGVTIGNMYTESFWARTNDGSTVTVQFRDDMQGGSAQKLITITPTWTLFSLSYTATATAGNVCRLWLRGTMGTSSYADLLLVGAQYETGSVATSRIPTTTAPVALTDYVASGTTLTLAEVPTLAAELTVDGTGVNLPLLQIGG